MGWGHGNWYFQDDVRGIGAQQEGKKHIGGYKLFKAYQFAMRVPFSWLIIGIKQ